MALNTPHGVSHVVIDFLNTVACPACRVGDALESTVSLRAWLRTAHPLLGGIRSEAELDDLRRLRGTLREVIQATVDSIAPPKRAVKAVNAAAARFQPLSALAWSRGSWIRVQMPPDADPADRLAGEVARAAINLLTGPERSKVMACHGPGCAHFLLARTTTQLWCSSSGCGNRVRVARHYRMSRKSGKVAGRAPRVAGTP